MNSPYSKKFVQAAICVCLAFVVSMILVCQPASDVMESPWSESCIQAVSLAAPVTSLPALLTKKLVPTKTHVRVVTSSHHPSSSDKCSVFSHSQLTRARNGKRCSDPPLPLPHHHPLTSVSFPRSTCRSTLSLDHQSSIVKHTPPLHLIPCPKPLSEESPSPAPLSLLRKARSRISSLLHRIRIVRLPRTSLCQSRPGGGFLSTGCGRICGC